MKALNYILLLSVLLTAGSYHSFAQDTTRKTTRQERSKMKAEEVKRLLESKKFTFHAQYANPLGGGVTSLNGQLINLSPTGTGHIYLNYDYDFKVRPDSIISFLPYFGRTTFAPSMNPNDSGVKFTSTKFGYNSKAGKKGNATIVITPKDAGYNQKMIMEVSDNGTATLQLIITNRTTISYDGYIEDK